MLEFLKRGQAARDVRLMAAQGLAQVPASELLSILVFLTQDEDDVVRTTATSTLSQLPIEAVRSFLAGTTVADDVRAYFDVRQVAAAADSGGAPTTGASAAGTASPDDSDIILDESPADRDSILQQITKMSFPDRLKAASKGSREVRAILVRDPSKMIAMAVLTSPKLTEPEVEAFARMGNVSEDVLRHIGSNRVWMKNYGIVLALVKNAKTPLGLSLNMMNRLNDRDIQGLSTDRNVPEPLRVAARKRVVKAVSR